MKLLFFSKIKYFSIVLLLLGCKGNKQSVHDNIQIAFMADVHLHDVYGQLRDSDFKGVLNPGNGKFVLARTMEAQLNSTRLFNENYFALLAALDNVVKKGIKYVVLPGDFSDDGQPINIRGLKRILDDYSTRHGITFLLITGNHDPASPFTIDAGKKDFLGNGGRRQPIFSKKGMENPDSQNDHPVVISQDVSELGYGKIIEMLGDYGFFPKKTDIYWETPFSTYNYDTYNFEIAFEESSYKTRYYKMPPYSSSIPDVSYLVEPFDGCWFLAIDANVYLPTERAINEPRNPASYKSAGIGYNNVLTHKTHLIDWIKKITTEAEKRSKKLIVFSHYPMVDFNDGASENIKNLLGEGSMQLHRVPGKDVAKIFANAGIKIHFGGHMHINDTGIRTTENGNTLVNVQIPSLAAYIPAYKLMTFNDHQTVEVETIVLDSVPRFKELFQMYEQEYSYLQSTGAKSIWNKEILQVDNYREYTMMHLKELVRLRFLPGDWPDDLQTFLLNRNGYDLLRGSNLEHIKLNESYEGSDSLYNQREMWDYDWQEVDSILRAEGVPKSFKEWTGFDLIYDIYRLRSADQLAIEDIGLTRIHQYKLVMNAIRRKYSESKFSGQLNELAEIFYSFLEGAPSKHFLVDIKNGKITTIE